MGKNRKKDQMNHYFTLIFIYNYKENNNFVISILEYIKIDFIIYNYYYSFQFLSNN